LNCVGIMDVLTFDSNNGNPLAMMQHYQVCYYLLCVVESL
jgi:hypothetical protein